MLFFYAFQKTHDLRCSTRLLHDKFQNISDEKNAIVQELGFGGSMHIPPMNFPHKLLKGLAYSFNLIENTLDTRYGVLIINPKNIGAALGLNASGALVPSKFNFKEFTEDDKEVYRSFQGKTLKQLTDLMMEIGVDGDEDRLKFKRAFILYTQMSFLLPTTINKVSPVHMPPIFHMDTIREWNCGGHILNFFIKGISERILKKKKYVDGCLYALMIVYFCESKHKNKVADAIPRPPWLQHWMKELLLEKIQAKIKNHMGIVKRAQLKEKLTKMKEEENKEKKKKTQKKKDI
ncbi:hypothetical protein Ahy_A04g019416 [Arachis hypogaea]|uniref:Aminotransferase-like plant mobile domain-containing protein n=1 Tax=Arachis hypogaea TaxID=3818 RepID=A0A445DFV9_ARAHY|nr:hypothetical protein Ahy_A04g019416 [Arachis hypogaea]